MTRLYGHIRNFIFSAPQGATKPQPNAAAHRAVRRPRAFAAALAVGAAAMLLGSGAAVAGVSGGGYYGALSSGSCTSKPSSNYYIGDCQDSGDAGGADVTIDGENNASLLVYGAVSFDTSGSATVSDNTVTVDDSNTSDVYGGALVDGNAKNNTVAFDDSTVTNDIYGGFVDNNGNANDNTVVVKNNSTANVIDGGIVGGDGKANGNTVTVQNSTVKGNIFGGRVIGTATTNAANNNRIILMGEHLDLTQARLIGGLVPAGTVSGNVLEVHSTGIEAFQAQFFDRYEFYLPAGTSAGDTVLTLTETTATDMSGATVGVTGTGIDLNAGDQVTLVHNDAGVKTSGIEQADIGPLEGVALQYDYTLQHDANNLSLAITKVQTRPQTKAPLEARAGSLAFVNQGAELAAGRGLQAAQRTGGMPLFFAISSGSSTYETGSETDVGGYNVIIGTGIHFGHFLVAPFVVGGNGSYDTYNTFPSHKVHGQGDVSNAGVGVLLQQQWDSGLYVEGALRGGHLSYDWASDDMAGAAHVAYDSSASYMGGHLGVGYKLAFSDAFDMDVSGKYFTTKLDGGEVAIAGDTYTFDSTNSQRLQIGARLNYAFSNSISAFANLAWLNASGGDARATVRGFDTPAPALDGSTGKFGLGLSYTPSGDSPFSLGFVVNGYTGTRDGVQAGLQLGYLF